MSNHTHRRSYCANKNLRFERLEQRTLLAADLGAMQNPVDPEDVNADGYVSPDDVLMIVNDLNAGDRTGRARQGFLDVDGDRFVSPSDALCVINRMNHHDAPGGDPAGSSSDGGVEQTPESRSIDGSGNHLDQPDWGSTGTQLRRVTTVEYGDGIAAAAGDDRLSAREISNLVAGQTESTLNDRGLSDLVWQWGQFIDHDIDLTGPVDPTESLPIEVPTGDPFFDPAGTGEATIAFDRSTYDKETGDAIDNPRQQTNAITAFIDGSNVYGSNEERAAALRTFVGGQLKTSDGDLLPFNEAGFDNAGGPSDTLFLAGDVRANEQVGLTAMHTLWVREHNRIADQIAARNPELSDEAIYQRARTVVIAEMQAITFNEFLPALLGEDAMGAYQGYDPAVNPSISNVFSTAAYRFGHSMLSSELLRLDSAGEVVEAGNLALRDAFFNPAELIDNGIDSILRGLASQQAQEIDTQLVDDVRNFLFGPPGSGGFDLAALNIQRGRDHGLADYNQVREDFGLERVSSFSEITSDPSLQAALETAYGDVDQIDAWVGGLAEDHVEGSSTGELVRTILVDQFTRLRAGDRFWYQNMLSGQQLREVEQTTLADVIRRNTDVENLPRNVFFISEMDPQRAHDEPRHHRPPQPAGLPVSGHSMPIPVPRFDPPDAQQRDAAIISLAGETECIGAPIALDPPRGNAATNLTAREGRWPHSHAASDESFEVAVDRCFESLGQSSS